MLPPDTTHAAGEASIEGRIRSTDDPEMDRCDTSTSHAKEARLSTARTRGAWLASAIQAVSTNGTVSPFPQSRCYRRTEWLGNHALARPQCDIGPEINDSSFIKR
jgi:hypothetical protein